MNSSNHTTDYDVAIVGGALSGSATALLLLRENPGLRVLIVEKSAQFGRRVGEATVEISAYFMGRVLGLTQFLNETQLVKQGLRFWFKNDEVKTLGESSEIGGNYQVRLPSYQLDRATFDEEVLRRAGAEGATIRRPASVTQFELSPGGNQTLTIRHNETTETIRARWIIDASGVAALLARKHGWWRSNTAHPIAAAWSRWKGVKDWDGLELAQTFPDWSTAVYGNRNTATNHVVGDGWWSWWIPLKGGDVSVGVVFDQRILDWPQDGQKVGERLKDFLMQHPVGREMIADATFEETDVHWRRNLAYYSTTFAGDGFVLVGDAAAFMDPFYSPGMDWISFTAVRAAALIATQRRGEPLSEKIAEHNRDFAQSYRLWFESIYQDKYEYMGEFDLMSIAFRLDLGLYYLGVVSQPFKYGPRALLSPPFLTPLSRPVFHLMKLYNQRLARIARRRRRIGALGRTNRGRRYLIPGFTLSGRDAVRLFKPLLQWIALELSEGWHTWGEGHAAEIEKAPAGPAAAAAADEPVGSVVST